jgi:hypothetical protein
VQGSLVLLQAGAGCCTPQGKAVVEQTPLISREQLPLPCSRNSCRMIERYVASL